MAVTGSGPATLPRALEGEWATATMRGKRVAPGISGVPRRIAENARARIGLTEAVPDDDGTWEL